MWASVSRPRLHAPENQPAVGAAREVLDLKEHTETPTAGHDLARGANRALRCAQTEGCRFSIELSINSVRRNASPHSLSVESPSSGLDSGSV